MILLAIGEFLLTVLFTLVIAGVALFMLCGIVIGRFMGAPYVRSAKKRVSEMMDIAAVRPGETVMDLGSGDGSLVIAAARAGARAIGIEMNPFLVWYSQIRIRLGDLSDHARIVRGNFRNTSLKDADVLLLYLLPATLASLRRKMELELKPGTRIVSNTFPIEGWKPILVKNGVFLYDRDSMASSADNQGPTAEIPQGKKERKPMTYGILFFGLCLLSLLANEIYFPHTSSHDPKKIEIPAGMGSREIGALLKSEGAIRSKWTFVIYTSVLGKASHLKPGTYLFVNAAIPEIADALVRGGTRERAITIPEGWSLVDIGEYFAREDIMPLDVFKKETGVERAAAWSSRFASLADKPDNAGLEGYLFPDTYRVFLNAEADTVITKMLGNFEAKMGSEFPNEIKHQSKTIFDIVIMASLIEKEVVSDSDRRTVSGVLWKRLEAGIPLQVDATIVYAKQQATSNKRQGAQKVSLEDTKIDSPYNTYRYRGLPPGPIANPGLSAIRAAIYPKTSPYLYYLSAPDGRTIFSRTFEEHNAAKERYLR